MCTLVAHLAARQERESNYRPTSYTKDYYANREKRGVYVSPHCVRERELPQVACIEPNSTIRAR